MGPFPRVSKVYILWHHALDTFPFLPRECPYNLWTWSRTFHSYNSLRDCNSSQQHFELELIFGLALLWCPSPSPWKLSLYLYAKRDFSDVVKLRILPTDYLNKWWSFRSSAVVNTHTCSLLPYEGSKIDEVECQEMDWPALFLQRNLFLQVHR